MKLTIVAATGGIGRQLVGQAVTVGHDVIAVVRDPGRLPAGAQRRRRPRRGGPGVAGVRGHWC